VVEYYEHTSKISHLMYNLTGSFSFLRLAARSGGLQW